jgi:hypothetical protein
MVTARLSLMCLAIAALFVSGCGKPPLPGPKPYPVHGKVMHRGQPAKGFRVAFHPIDAQWNVRFSPSAVTDENGEYRLRSYHPGDGAPPGQYAVTSSWPRHLNTIDEPAAVPEVDQLQGRYGDPRKPQFTATVREGDNAIETFELK